MKILIPIIATVFTLSVFGQLGDRPDSPRLEQSRQIVATGKGPCTARDVPVGTRLRSIVADVFERSSGRRVSGLKSEDFVLSSESGEMEIARFENTSAPMTAVLLFDTSPSSVGMLGEMGRAATDFMAALKARDRIAIYSFDGEVAKITGPTEISKMSGLNVRITRRSQGTKLFDAVQEVLSSSVMKSPGRKVIVIFTDGNDTLSSSSNRTLSLELARENDALIYAFQHPRNGGPGSKPDDYLNGLANATGGRLTMVRSMEEAAKGLAKVPDEIRSQYVGCFLSEADSRDKLTLRLRSKTTGLALQYTVY